MVLEKVKALLRVNEFNEHKTNIDEITLYEKTAWDAVYILLLCDFTGREQPDSAQLRHIVWKISTDAQFSAWDQRILVLLFAEDMVYARHIIQDGITAWIIDSNMGRLRIYEDQPEDYAGLRHQLEHLLEGEREKGWEQMRNNSSYTPCNVALAVINVLVFAAMNLTGGDTGNQQMVRWGAMYTPYMSELKEIYRLFTAMFLHFDVGHLTSNMIILISLGSHLERAIGSRRYVILYILSGLGAGGLSCIYNMLLGNTVVAAGASGAIFGVIGGLFCLTLKNRGRFREMTASRLALMIGYILYSGFTTPGIDNAAHIGGMLTGVAVAFCMRRNV